MNPEEKNDVSIDKEDENNISNEENYELDESIQSNKIDLEKSNSLEYNFGWNKYSEVTNGRFAMLGFIAILLIELISKKSFLSWSGILS